MGYERTIVCGQVSHKFVSPKDNPYFSATIGVREKRKDGWETKWVKIAAWGKLAEMMATHVENGSTIAVDGKIRLKDPYTDREGTLKSSYELVIDNMSFCDPYKGDDSSDEDKPSTPKKTRATGSERRKSRESSSETDKDQSEDAPEENESGDDGSFSDPWD